MTTMTFFRRAKVGEFGRFEGRYSKMGTLFKKIKSPATNGRAKMEVSKDCFHVVSSTMD
jgi:hypothetical protein